RIERRRFAPTMRAMRCAEVTMSATFWQRAIELAIKHHEKLHKGIQEVRTALSKSRSRAVEDLFDDDNPGTKEQVYNKLENGLRLFSTVPSEADLLRWISDEQVGRVIGLDGFLPVGVPFPDRVPSLDYLLTRFSRKVNILMDWYPNITRLAMVG